MTRQTCASHGPQLKTIETDTTLPDEIVELILCRLSVRQLLQCRCVSKSWCALIDSLRFIKKQHNKQYAIFTEEGNVPLVLDSGQCPANFGDPTKFYLLSTRSEDVPLCVTSDLERDSTPYSPMNLGRFRTLRLSGFVNGVALLVWDCRRDNNSYFALWNPATREFKVVRPRRPRSDRKRHGDIIALGFDPKSNDFKVIRSINYEDVTGRLLCICKYELYSLNKDTWKSIENPLPRIEIASSDDFCGGYFNGVSYWSCISLEAPHSYIILSFDFSSEVLKVHDPPVALDYTQSCWVTKYMDSLAFIYGENDDASNLCVISVMSGIDVDNQGFPSSWKYLFTIRPFSLGSPFSFHALLMDGHMLFTINVDHRMESILYNPTTNAVSRRFGLFFSGCYEYVESLFRLSKRHVDS